MKLLVIAVLAGLASCASLPEGVQPGTGVVQSVEAVPARVLPSRRSPGQRDSGRRSTGWRWEQAYVLTIRMDDGRVQELVQESALAAGERVEVTGEGRVVRR